jgi:hypothetical protein
MKVMQPVLRDTVGVERAVGVLPDLVTGILKKTAGRA